MKRNSWVARLTEDCKTIEASKRQRMWRAPHHVAIYPKGPPQVTMIMEIPRDIIHVLYQQLSQVIMSDLYHMHVKPLEKSITFKVYCLEKNKAWNLKCGRMVYNIPRSERIIDNLTKDIHDKKQCLSVMGKIRTMPSWKDMYRLWSINQVTGLYNKSYS